MARRPSLRQRLDDVAARLDPEVRDAFLAATRDVVRRTELRRLVRALEQGDVEGALRAVRLDPDAYRDLVESLRRAYIAGGDAAAGTIPTLTGPDGEALVIRFGVRNPRAEEYLERYSSTLVTRIVDDQREAIRDTLRGGLEAGRNPREVGRDVIGRINRATGRREGGVVGLTQQQAGYVANARDELQSDDPSVVRRYFDRERRDRRFDRTVEKAIREGRALSQGDVSKITGRYSDRLLQLRGETIARTEMLTSLNAASREAYEQAIESGAVQRQNVKKIWRTARDPRVRDTHAMLHRTERSMDERFANGLLYPGEPGAPARQVVNCRCVAEYRIDFLAEELA